MRIAVTYDAGARQAAPDAADIVHTVGAVIGALGRLGHAAVPVALGHPFERVLPRLSAADMIFNLTEGLDGRGEGEPRLAAFQELTGRPLTGARSGTLALARRKDHLNALLAKRGLPVPEWVVAGPATHESWTTFPAIVKPIGEDGSVGIHEGSVVDDRWELRAALAAAAVPVLVQAFVGGRELNVGIVGGEVLPIGEIVFSGRQRVVSYAAKWSPGSDADRAARPECPARISATLHDRAVALAREAWEIVGGCGYARVDLRTDGPGLPYILEVNPNPDLSPGAGLARMADAAGWGYDGLVARILAEAR